MEKPELPARKEAPQKMTKARLDRLLGELEIQYAIDGEGGDFKIIIDLPEEHVREHRDYARRTVLSEGILTNFDRDKLFPLIRRINESINFKCRLQKAETDDQIIISVSKK